MRYFGVEHCSSGVHVDAVQQDIGILTIAQEVVSRTRNPYPFGLTREAAERFVCPSHLRLMR